MPGKFQISLMNFRSTGTPWRTCGGMPLFPTSLITTCVGSGCSEDNFTHATICNYFLFILLIANRETEIQEAFKMISDSSCIRFVSHSTEFNYLKLLDGSGWAWPSCFSPLTVKWGEYWWLTMPLNVWSKCVNEDFFCILSLVVRLMLVVKEENRSCTSRISVQWGTFAMRSCTLWDCTTNTPVRIGMSSSK